MKKSISVGETLKLSWDSFKENVWVLILFVLMTLAVEVLFGMFSCSREVLENGVEKASLGWGCTFVNFFHYIVNVLILLGFATVAVIAAKGQKIQFQDFFSKFNLFFHYLVASVLYSVILAVGLVLLIVPGIYWGIKYALFPFMVVENKAFGWTALKLSAQATYGAKWDLFGLYVAILLILFAGLLTFGLGLFIAIPLTWIAQAYAWKKLTSVGE